MAAPATRHVFDAATSPLAIPAAKRGQLADALARTVRGARRHGERLVAASWRIDRALDPSAVVLASRGRGEPWMCFEQPDRDRAAIATLGSAATITDHGAGRFDRIGARWRKLAGEAVCEPPQGPPGSGLIATAAFAFADDGANALHWRSFASASLVVPELALARRGEEVWCTVAVLAGPDDLPEQLLGRVQRRLDSLRTRELPLVDPHPTERHHVGGALAPEHYEGAVARAVELIGRGELEKIVLAREVEVHAPAPYDVAALHGVLRSSFSGCFVLAVGRGDDAFIAASPELLIRRDGLRASTIALAGSTGRSSDPAVDEHLGERLLRSAKNRHEHAIVARAIEQQLRPHAVWVTMPDAPSLVRIANIQHLATPIRAQLAHPLGAIELAGLLHPTPAVGGAPAARAIELIPALEGIDRGWYAGPIGWTDANGDGEFAVALRCALLQGNVARCYAGVGVVADSDPPAELAETEVKLAALLGVIS